MGPGKYMCIYTTAEISETVIDSDLFAAVEYYTNSLSCQVVIIPATDGIMRYLR